MLTNTRVNTKPLTREQEELINTLVYYQEEFEQPTEADVKKIRVSIYFSAIALLIFLRH